MIIDIAIEQVLQQELQALQEENERLQKEERIAVLRRHIAQERELRTCLQSSLTSGSSPLSPSQSPHAAHQPHQDGGEQLCNNSAVGPLGIFNEKLTSSLRNIVTSLDDLLHSTQSHGHQARTWQDQAVNHSPKPLQADHIKFLEMFLCLSSLPNGDKTLWIVNFVDSTIPETMNIY